jgi:hypothetical protein
MDVLRLIVSEPDDPAWAVVEIMVNDTPLIGFIADIESESAAADGQAELAGAYSSLAIEDFDGRVSKHLMGSPGSHRHCGPLTKSLFLGCNCGHAGCWPLMARIEVGQETVVWHEFEQPFRQWDYRDLTFTFTRGQYESALSEADDECDRLAQEALD